MSSRILAVEDTPALRSLLQLCLTRGGYAVDLAEEGESAVRMFRAGQYVAVIMDIQMPVMNGLAAVALMRASEKEKNSSPVPILALTANTQPADLRKYMNAGFSGMIRKPFGREELLAAVARELGAQAGPNIDEPILVTADPDIRDLIPPFLNNCRRETEAMSQALERQDYQAIAAASHRFVGAGACFGFQLLSDEGRLVEAAAKAANRDEVRQHLEALRLYLKRVSVIYP